ncbi:condensation domain-containing protein [Streptomyces sp. NPDC058457]|uniref:condensation domain-containing protein n=1 Tax=Streptomyces sp. NPDC058457 TaxID=3346507 RepID=UPI00364C953B
MSSGRSPRRPNDRRRHQERVSSKTLTPSSDGGTNDPVSHTQRGLWLLSRLGEHGAAYNVPLAFRLTGSLDRDALNQAFTDAVERRTHPVRPTLQSERPPTNIQRISRNSCHNQRAQRSHPRLDVEGPASVLVLAGALTPGQQQCRSGPGCHWHERAVLAGQSTRFRIPL